MSVVIIVYCVVVILVLRALDSSRERFRSALDWIKESLHNLYKNNDEYPTIVQYMDYTNNKRTYIRRLK